MPIQYATDRALLGIRHPILSGADGYRLSVHAGSPRAVSAGGRLRHSGRRLW
mgnify:CR=1 FL=1